MTHSGFSEQTFLVAGNHHRGKRWHEGASHPVIAIHGWLDNAGSFDPMAPMLEDFDLLALDSIGHGKSDFRSADSSYLMVAEVAEIFEIADAMDWPRFSLIGHSRGAGIASLCAGTFPDRIEKLVLIDGAYPSTFQRDQTAENLHKHIRDTQRLRQDRGTLFPTRDAAIAGRANGMMKVTLEAAEILARRSLIEDKEAGGFRWHADARLKSASIMKLGEEDIISFYKRISAPTLMLYAENGILKQAGMAADMIEQIGSLTKKSVPGGHHTHMEDGASACAEHIRRFFAD